MSVALRGSSFRVKPCLWMLDSPSLAVALRDRGASLLYFTGEKGAAIRILFSCLIGLLIKGGWLWG